MPAMWLSVGGEKGEELHFTQEPPLKRAFPEDLKHWISKVKLRTKPRETEW